MRIHLSILCIGMFVASNVGLQHKNQKLEPGSFRKFDVEIKSKDGTPVTCTYYVSNFQARQDEASVFCESVLGKKLLSIDNADENAIVKSLIDQNGGGFHWTSGKMVNGDLLWLSNYQGLMYTNWVEYGGREFKTYPSICVNSADRNWDTCFSESKNRFICE